MLKSEALQILESKVASCTKCREIAEYRSENDYKTVPGVGHPNAKVMVIGEAAGKNEAEQGVPFVGKAGKLLTNILKAAGWPREQIFITNVLKCRPPNNRDPEPGEARNCRPFLDAQIKIIDPSWILCFGRIASVHLLGKDLDTKMGEMRGEHEYEGRKVICTYHPSYLLRNASAKQDVWEDLQPAILALQSK